MKKWQERLLAFRYGIGKILLSLRHLRLGNSAENQRPADFQLRSFGLSPIAAIFDSGYLR
jgi:hypothetical protein